MLYAKLWKLQEKLCKSGCISRPPRRWRASGRQHNASAADSLLWSDSGASRSSSLNGNCWWPAAALCAAGPAAGTAEWPPAFLQPAFGCGWTATAIATDSRSLHNLHLVALGAVGEITWFEIAFANDQSQASLLLQWLMNDHAKTCNIGVDSSTYSIKNTSCNSLDKILQLSVVEKKFTTQLKQS